jgi:hypothetical protein
LHKDLGVAEGKPISTGKLEAAKSGASPAERKRITFAENAVGEDLNMDTAQIGNTITMNVTNLDGAAAHDFRASLTGDAVLTAT